MSQKKAEKVSILIPTIRPESAKRSMSLAVKLAGIPEKHIEVLSLHDENRQGAPKTLKQLVMMSSHDLVVFLGDDTVPQKDWLKHAIRAMRTFPGQWGLVGLNDGFHDGEKLATHWMAHKKLLPHLDGEFFHTGYVHCFCDMELTMRCRELARYKWAPDAKIKHNHPITQKDESLWDEDYRRVYSEEVQYHDRNLFNIRRSNGWRTAVLEATPQHRGRTVVLGIPAGGHGKDKFWTSLAKMRYAAAHHGINTHRLREKGSIVQHNRNLIVDKALRREGIPPDIADPTHILFMDDDQTYEPDVLIRLLEHNKDIVGANVYRKGPPFAPVTSVQKSHDQLFVAVHIRPDSPDAGLRRVTSLGTGCVLIKMDVFKKMKFPWFEIIYAPRPDSVNKDDPNLIQGHSMIGEDTWFFVKAQKIGYKIYCDFTIEIGHIGDYVYTWKDYERYIKENGREQVDNEDKSAAPGGNGDQQHDQPGDQGRLQHDPVDGPQLDIPAGVHNAHGIIGRYDVQPAE